MLRKTIEYKDVDGNDVTDDFYFSFSKPEFARLEFTTDFTARLKDASKSEDAGKTMVLFEEILRLTVGKRSADGRHLIKSPEVTGSFMNSNAYEVLFMELLTDATKAADFIRGVMPADIADKIGPDGRLIEDVVLPESEVPAWIRENRDPTKEELKSMSPEEMREAFARKTGTATPS